MKTFFDPRGVFTTRNLAVMAMLIAVRYVLSQFTIAPTPQFKMFTLAYIPTAMAAALYGPWAALVFGLVGDTVGYMAKPIGPYFPGYAISEMLAAFIYACFSYRQRITLAKMTAARLLILITVIFGLNFVWGSMQFGTAASGFFTSVRLWNNLVQLPVYVFFSTWAAKFAVRMEARRENITG